MSGANQTRVTKCSFQINQKRPVHTGHTTFTRGTRLNSARSSGQGFIKPHRHMTNCKQFGLHRYDCEVMQHSPALMILTRIFLGPERVKEGALEVRQGGARTRFGKGHIDGS